jgi:hypothetical protein
VALQIEAAEWQEVGPKKESKIVPAFIRQHKGLILNKTNANALKDAWGKSEAAWVGKWVEARATQTSYGPGVGLTPCEAPVTATGGVPF